MDKSNLNILIVEDNPGDAFLIEEYLDDSPMFEYNITHANTLQKAQDELVHNYFDSIILDLNLPDSNHLETLRKVMPNACYTAIIVVTGLDDEFIGKSAVEKGAQDYIVKNKANSEVLNKAIYQAIARKNDQNRLNHLNRVLAAVRSVNRLIIHEDNEQRLINKICEILVLSNGYYDAWITLVNKDLTIFEAAQYGNSTEINTFFDLFNKKQHPQCILDTLKAKSTYTHKTSEQCAKCPLFHVHKNKSSLIIKLQYKNTLYGFIGASVSYEYAHDNEEKELFNEIANDLSFGLYSIGLNNEEKILKRELEKSAKDFKFITENSIDCIWQINNRLKYKYISPSIKSITGYAAEMSINRSFIDDIYTDDQEKVEQLLYNYLNTGVKNEPIVFETWFIGLNKKVPVEIVAKHLTNSKGVVIGLQGSTREVSERVEKDGRISTMNEKLKKQNDEYLIVNEELEESLNRIQTINNKLERKDYRLSVLFEASRTVLEYDKFKPTAQKLFEFCKAFTSAKSGYIALLSENGDENEVLFLDSGGLECTVDPNLPMPLRGLRNIAYQLKQPVYDNDFMNSEWVKLMPDGHVDLKNVLFAPLVLKEKAVGLIGLANKPEPFNSEDVEFIKSISEICSIALFNSRVNDSLIEAKKKAEESDRLKSAFLANMSHEIRTPMNAIIGFSELLTNKDLSADEKKEFFNFIQSNGESLVKIIDDIIDISMIETKQLKIHICAFNLKSLLDELYIYFSQIIISKRANNVDLLFNIDKKVLPSLFIISDKIRLKQVIVNLLNNAIKYTTQGSITLNCVLGTDKIHFSVVDTGVGIPIEKQKKVFNRFVQYSDTFVSRHYGTGLGLAISKEIVQLLGGVLKLKSVELEGSEFSFEINYEPSKVELTGPNNTPKNEIVNWMGKRILIVDDEESSFVLLKRLLSKTNACIDWANDGAKGIQYCQENKYNLVIMDIKMPNVNGILATKIIKKSQANLPIIIQTAFAMSTEKKLAIEAGCDGYVTKPINLTEFIELANKIILD